MLLQNNPTYSGYYNPWEGQGDTIDTGGGFSSPADAPSGFWDWWGDHGDEATDFGKSILCMIKPETCRQNSGYPPSGQPAQNNTIMYVLLGIVVVLLIVFMFKK
ncbi:MAG: hypothetical protein KDC85_18285 [Saprospiraceae bacterium]|nr:hypothetical protein [Saprospiraceae bacterium]MCB9325884.1 hypothetical protein [Lewinellaceae bacterium]